jgi:hypothetical protein
MATTGNYKEYERLQRSMTIEDLFNLGMNYTNTPLAEGYAKLLVNFDLKNQGTGLAPRGGIKSAHNSANIAEAATGTGYAVHHVGTTLVQTSDGADASLYKYVLIAPMISKPLIGVHGFALSAAKCLIDIGEQNFIIAECSYPYIATPKHVAYAIHDLGYTNIQTDGCNSGKFVSIEGNTYLPVISETTASDKKFVRMNLQFTDANKTAVTLSFVTLEPKEVPASQVINTGYNLMKSDPYDFVNAQNVTGSLVLNGVIPKDASGKIKLTADVGEVLIYHLHYTYPAGDVTKKYMVQWEVRDTATSAVTEVLQQVRKSASYTPGDAITYAYTVAYKQFTMVVKVYDEAVVTAHTYVSDEDDAKMLEPIKVITVSSYYTTASVAKNAANLTPRVYSLPTCRDMCAWQQRLVLWGVVNAETTLFVSQPNLPEYIPYPNNVEVFSEEIMMCVPYLTYLLVFTTNKLYQLTLTNDGTNTFYTTKCIQERLIMSKDDAATIQVVKNMVYFKSGNYYYMIVPHSSAGAGELQLAPISKPIEAMLDNFKASTAAIIDSVYNINYKFGLTDGTEDSYRLTIRDYTNYLDGAVMRNIYKFELAIIKDNVVTATYFLDFVLNYDTILRAWTIYLYESTDYRLVPYESTVTSGTVYATLQPVSSTSKAVRLTTVTFDNTSPKDEYLTYQDTVERQFVNHQLIDTGYRAHFSPYKKRFREVQFSVNNTAQDTLLFYTAFIVDDDVRKSLFEYTTQHITDPTSPDYGLVYVERGFAEPTTVPGAFKLDETDGWALDFAKFPDITVVKVKHRVSGKGYHGKLIILSKNELLYELLGTNWVYRKMNAR